MAAKSNTTVPDEWEYVKGSGYGSDRARVAASILRDLGKSPRTKNARTAPSTPSPIPSTESRLALDDDDDINHGGIDHERFGETWRRGTSALPPEVLLDHIVERLLDRFEERLAGLAEFDTTGGKYRYCAICSHDTCRHYHAVEPYAREDVEQYLPAKRSTIYTWLHRGEMPRPVSGPPYEWDPHVIACFKYDHVNLSSGHYDRNHHLTLLPLVKAKREEKRSRTSAKLSAHMTRVNARRRAFTRKVTTTKKSTDSGKQRRPRR